MYWQSEKNLLNSNVSPTCPCNMENFGLLAAEICWQVWGTLANCVVVVLLHETPVVGISQTLQHWTEGATYIRQGGHHVEHWPTFLVQFLLLGCLHSCYSILHYFTESVAVGLRFTDLLTMHTMSYAGLFRNLQLFTLKLLTYKNIVQFIYSC